MAPLIPQDSILHHKDVFSGSNVSVIHVFYKNNHFRSQRKEEIIGFADLLCKKAHIILSQDFTLY